MPAPARQTTACTQAVARLPARPPDQCVRGEERPPSGFVPSKYILRFGWNPTLATQRVDLPRMSRGTSSMGRKPATRNRARRTSRGCLTSSPATRSSRMPTQRSDSASSPATKVWLESRYRAVKAKANVTKRVHPEAIGLQQGFGHSAMRRCAAPLGNVVTQVVRGGFHANCRPSARLRHGLS
jgi:hypothetical protein